LTVVRTSAGGASLDARERAAHDRRRVMRRHGLMMWPTKSMPRSIGLQHGLARVQVRAQRAGRNAVMSASASLSHCADSCSR
jgi:hypothetical protein